MNVPRTFQIVFWWTDVILITLNTNKQRFRMFETALTNKLVNISFPSYKSIVFVRRTRLSSIEARSCVELSRSRPSTEVKVTRLLVRRCRGSVADTRSALSHHSNHRRQRSNNNPHSRIDLTLESRTDWLKTFSQWGGFIRGCVCMCSAPNGRKNRPRSATNIFQIGKSSMRDPERRESTESSRRAQRAMDDCRTVSVR